MILLFIRAAMLGDIISQAFFNIRGPTPSRPVDFPGSYLQMKFDTCDVVLFNLIFTSPQQSFSYKGTGLLGLNQY